MEGEGDRSRLAEQRHRREPAARPREVRGDAAPGMAETGDDEVAEAVTVEVGGEGADRAREPADKASHPPVLPFRSRRIEAHHRPAGRIAGGEGADQGDEPGAAREGSEVNGRRVDGDLRHRPEGAVVDPHPAARAVADEDPARRLVDEDGGDRGGLAVRPGRGQPDREPGGGPVRGRRGRQMLRRRPVPVVVEDLRPVGEREQRFRRVRAGGKARVRPPSPPAELVDPEPRPHLGENVPGPRRAIEGGGVGHRVASPAPRRRKRRPRCPGLRPRRPWSLRHGGERTGHEDAGKPPHLARLPAMPFAGNGAARPGQLSRFPAKTPGRGRSGRCRRVRAGPRGLSPRRGTRASRPRRSPPGHRAGARRR